MSETKLKPCAHCGGIAIYKQPECSYKGWYIHCVGKEDEACCACSDVYDTLEEAIAAWNRRDTETELLEALKELVHEQCQLTCKDHDKECTPTCWVLKHKQLIAKAKGETT